MPAKLTVENHAAAFDSDLTAALAFTLDNTGQVDAEIYFDASGSTAPLPAGTSRSFDFIGDRYSGKLYGTFGPNPQGLPQRLTVIKTLYFC